MVTGPMDIIVGCKYSLNFLRKVCFDVSLMMMMMIAGASADESAAQNVAMEMKEDFLKPPERIFHKIYIQRHDNVR